jgi:regulator of RNase E activity RraB
MNLSLSISFLIYIFILYLGWKVSRMDLSEVENDSMLMSYDYLYKTTKNPEYKDFYSDRLEYLLKERKVKYFWWVLYKYSNFFV